MFSASFINFQAISCFPFAANPPLLAGTERQKHPIESEEKFNYLKEEEPPGDSSKFYLLSMRKLSFTVRWSSSRLYCVELQTAFAKLQMFTFRNGFYLPLFPTWVQIPHILSQVCAVLKDVPLGHSFWVWVTVGLVSDFWLQEMRAPSSLQLLERKSWSFYFYWQVSGNGRMEGAAFTLPVFQGDHLWCEIRLVNKKNKK